MSLASQLASNMSGSTAAAATARAALPGVVTPASAPQISGAAMNLLGSVTKLDGKDLYFNWRTAIEFPFVAMGLWDHIIGAPGTECPISRSAEIATWKAFDNSARALLFIVMSANEQRHFKGCCHCRSVTHGSRWNVCRVRYRIPQQVTPGLGKHDACF
jgi:hypothetical protein